MKIFKYALPFAALALLASCSNDNLDVTQPGEDAPTQKLEPGTYLNINISIPTSGLSRADGGSFDDYYDGLKNEYAVQDATLYLFDPTNENLCIDVVPLNTYFENPDPKNENSTGITQVKKIVGLKMDESIIDRNSETGYDALVILNKDGLKDLPKKDQTKYNDWIYAAQQEADMFVGEGESRIFTMTNALGWAGSPIPDELPKTLVHIGKENLYYENDTEEHTAINVYVQRGVAKVTLANGLGKMDLGTVKSLEWKLTVKNPLTGQETQEKHYDFLVLTEWYLDICNQWTYPVQNLEGKETNINQWYSQNGISIGTGAAATNKWSSLESPLDRFVGTHTGFNRVFWAVDPNYSGTYQGDGNDEWFAKGEIVTTPATPAYCLENTMSVQDMMQDRTTRVVFTGKYFADYSKGEMGALQGPSKEATAPHFLSYEGRYCAIPSILELALEGENLKSCQEKISDIFKAEGSKYDEWKAGQIINNTEDDYKKAYADALESVYKSLDVPSGFAEKVNFHKDGVVYYVVRIRHFNDVDLGLDEPYQQIGKEYPKQKDQNFLGRYGVVRNNWYELSVNSFAGPGSWEITTPDPDDPTPDDDPDKLLLDVNVNILAWAKRQQNVELK